MYASSPEESIHRSIWPVHDPSKIDEKAEFAGDRIIGLISEIRKEKNKRGIPLNKPVKEINIHTSNEELADIIKMGTVDIK